MDKLEFVLRRMTSMGDECLTVTLPELQRRLHGHLGASSAAVRADGGAMTLIGSEFPRVMEHIRELAQQDVRRIEVLLIPRVSGG
jgi:hypothetical protein